MSDESMNSDRDNESPPERNQLAAGRTTPILPPLSSSERNRLAAGLVAPVWRTPPPVDPKPVQAPRFPPS